MHSISEIITQLRNIRYHKSVSCSFNSWKQPHASVY